MGCLRCDSAFKDLDSIETVTKLKKYLNKNEDLLFVNYHHLIIRESRNTPARYVISCKHCGRTTYRETADLITLIT